MVSRGGRSPFETKRYFTDSVHSEGRSEVNSFLSHELGSRFVLE